MLPDFWAKLFRFAGISQRQVQKIDSALAPIAALSTLSPFAWVCALIALGIGKGSQEWPFFERVFWAFFIAGCIPPACALIVASGFAATDPSHLRSAKFALEFEKMKQQGQGNAPLTIDISASEVGSNPNPKIVASPEQPKQIQEAKDAG